MLPRADRQAIKYHARMSIPARLKQLGLTLPPAPKPVAAYVPFVRTGKLVYISGQLPFPSGGGKVPEEYLGRVPSTVTIELAAKAARQAALNALAVLNSAIDGTPDGKSLEQVKQIVRLGVFVCCEPGFFDQPKVANGASELLVQVFDEQGRHARAAVGSVALPLGACVEIEMIAEVA